MPPGMVFEMPSGRPKSGGMSSGRSWLRSMPVAVSYRNLECGTAARVQLNLPASSLPKSEEATSVQTSAEVAPDLVRHD